MKPAGENLTRSRAKGEDQGSRDIEQPAACGAELGGRKDFFIVALALLVVVFLGYGFCMSGYFLADDTWQVQFAYRVVSGEWHLAFDNFVSSYLGVPALDFYRPLLGFTYILDYAVWGMSAAGWYFSNLVYGYVSALLYYLTVRALTGDFGPSRSFCCALAAALVFAAYPLHVEDICWISGRADLLASVFYLPALCLAAVAWHRFSFDSAKESAAAYWSRGQVRPYVFSLFFFGLALLSKESPVTLPLAVAALPLASGGQVRFVGWKKWLYFILPYFLVILPYLALRAYALGSAIGGYSGDFDRVLSRFLLDRWSDPLTLMRLILPLPAAVFGDSATTTLNTILLSLYAAILGLYVVRFFCQKFAPRTYLFLLILAVQAILPLHKLWSLDANLHNERIYYFLTMVLALTFPWLVFAPKSADHHWAKTHKFTLSPAFEFVLDRVFLCLFALVTSVFVLVDFSVSSVWVDAGKQVRGITAGVQKLASQSSKELIILGIPREFSASHVVLLGFSFKEFFEPPFVKEPISDRLLTFHSCLAGAEEAIDAARFREVVASNSYSGHYIWSTKKIDFDCVKLAPFANFDGQALPLATSGLAKPGALHPVAGQHAVRFANAGPNSMMMGLDGVTEKGGLVVEDLDINPLDYDYLSFDLAVVPNYKLYGVSVYYDDKKAGEPFSDLEPLHFQVISLQPPARRPTKDDFAADGQLKMKWLRVQMRLSHEWRWFRQERIRRLRLVFHSAQRLVVNNFVLESALRKVPQVHVVNSKQRSSGDFVVDFKQPTLQIDADAGRIEQAAKMQLAISRVNESFDNELLFEDARQRENSFMMIDGVKGRFELPVGLLKQTGYYDLKVRALDKNDQPLGDWSEGPVVYRPSEKGPAGYYRGN